MRSLFWFGLGGYTAYALHRHIEEKHGPDGWHRHCMKHSWGWRREEEQRRMTAASENAPLAGDSINASASERAPSMGSGSVASERDVSQASEKLVSTVKAGVSSVMQMLTDMEAAVRQQRALREQREFAQRAAPVQTPLSPAPQPSAAPNAALENMMDAAKAVPPTYTPASTTHPDPAMSQVLAAIDKINARLDSLSASHPPLNASESPKRLV